MTLLDSPGRTTPEAPVGLIAGHGSLPVEVAVSARRHGRQVVCVDVLGGDPKLQGVSDVYYAVPFGDLGEIIEAFRRHGVRELLLAGKVDKLPTIRNVKLDAYALRAAQRVLDHRDTSILGAILAVFEESGFEIGSQTRYIAHLVPAPGVLSRRPPSEREMADIRAGLRFAAEVAKLDIGQAVAVRKGAVVAVEAAEGTDAMIRRAGSLADGVVVVKVSRPHQDPRYDLPVVGPDTLRALSEARGTALAVEAGRAILLERDQVIAAAAGADIAVVAEVVPRADA